MKRKITICLTLASLLVPGASAQKKSVLDIKESITDSNIVYPESFEKDTQKLLDSWYMRTYTATDDRYRTSGDPGATDEQIKARLAAMPCIIEMPYNQVVRSYIDRYTQRGRDQVAAILGLSNYYTPIFEQALEAAGLPLELKYLPVIESGLDPNAVSRHGATGLWQFMLGTARGLGMEVNSLVDERRDAYVSSEKAASYLKDLYATYGDWSLAIAAYNCGPGTVNKALRRAGGDLKKLDFWSIYNYLPAETRGYVPMFIAANYVMNYYPEHNISPVLPTKPLVTDTIGVSERIHFNQISEVLDIPVEELRLLNPQFRADIIPGNGERTYYLILPSQQVHAYLMSESDIRNHDAEKYAVRTEVEPGGAPADALLAEAEIPADDTSAEDLALVQGASTRQPIQGQPTTSKPTAEQAQTVVHTVKQGESIAQIAEKYHVTPMQIKTWNHLRRTAVRPGQQLKITTTAELAEAAQNPAQPAAQNPAQPAAQAPQPKQQTQPAAQQTQQPKQNTKKAEPKKAPQPTTHKIKSGENLSKIAAKYGVSVAELKKANNMTGDNIRAGDNLKIPAKGSSKSSSSKKSSKKRKR